MLSREEGRPVVITQEGHDFLANFVTDTKGKVYVLRESIPSAVAASALGRLSHSNDDVRVLLLKEFVQSLPVTLSSNINVGRETTFLQKVISKYGDDSVAQLAGLRVVVQGASNILSKVLERPRAGISCLEQSSRYNYLDEKIIEDGDSEPRYRYKIPDELSETDRCLYVTLMDEIFLNYSIVVRDLTNHFIQTSNIPLEERDFAWRAAVKAKACDVARDMLPVATMSNVGIYASAQAIDNLIMHLRGHELLEARETGDALLREVRKVLPVFFERTDRDDRGGATTAYLRETKESFEKYALEKYGTFEQTESVILNHHYPPDESVAIRQILYASGAKVPAHLEVDELRDIVKQYAGERLNRRHKPGRMLEISTYNFLYRTSYGIFRALQRHRYTNALEWQKLRLGDDYEIPAILDECGYTHLFKQNFEKSEYLAKLLERSYGDTIAQYALLLGHKINWSWSLNLRELMHIVELRTTPAGHPEYRLVCQKMHELVSKVHPILASTVIFLNKDESPELARLAAERAAAFKLSKLQ